jgi:diadenosine tetraphosphate (Ap4A) HIT family hydrolase
VELHDLGDAEAFSLMGDMRRVSRALKDVTGAVKINVDIHGNTLPHLHAHFFPRYVGDPYEDGPIDFRRSE